MGRVALADARWRDGEDQNPHSPAVDRFNDDQAARTERLDMVMARPGSILQNRAELIPIGDFIATLPRLRSWLRRCRPGDRMIYHIGQIGFDRAYNNDLDQRAQIVNALCEIDVLAASQKRAGEETFIYHAKRTSHGSIPNAFIDIDKRRLLTAHAWRVLRCLKERQASFAANRWIARELTMPEEQAALWISLFEREGYITVDEIQGVKVTKKGMRAIG